METVRIWLTSIGLAEHAVAFAEQRIDFEMLGRLTEGDLKELGLPIGHRKRFLAAVAMLSVAKAGSEAANAAVPTAELLQRRHITLMFCDIVNSTALAEGHEAEDVVEVIQAYRALCGRAIAKYEGSVARYVGDGILAYFGYPVAHEEDPERTVRAALEITRGIGGLELPGNIGLEVRIGIASGQVIVGDLVSAGGIERQSVVGATPNLAARIQGLAPPNGIIIAESTHALVKGYFICDDLGTHELRGFAEPVRCWMVEGERALVSRFVARHASGRLPRIIERDRELATLRAVWQRALAGEGGTVFIHGEAGIGKSHLIEHFLTELSGDELILHFPTSPFDTHSPLYAVKARLREASGITRDDDVATRLRKLERSIVGGEEERRRGLPIYASLFALPMESAPALTPRQLKEATFDFLLDQFQKLSTQRPTIIAIEDMHWLDPTSSAFVELIRAELPSRRAIVVATSRDPPHAAWSGRPDTHVIELSRLSVESCGELVRSVLGDKAVGLDLRIAERSEGIPLIAEELARSLLVVGLRAEGNGTAIPASLRQSLAARLDQAGPAKDLAQACAVIGRSVDYELAAAVAGLDREALDPQIDALVRAGIVYRSDAAERRTYVFRHALLQDAAYNSLIRDRRKLLHARTATALAAHFPHVSEEQPELLAHHFAEAGELSEALSHWLHASRRGLARSALVESTAHLRRGLDALQTLPETPSSKERRLQFLTLLGPALLALSGPGSGEVESLYAEAFQLCGELTESTDHFAVYWGWWRVARDYTERKHRANALLRSAVTRADNEPLLQAHHCQWASHFDLGDLAGCCDHIDAGLSIYARGDYRAHATLYGNHDAKVCAHGERALVHWMQGRPDSALVEQRKSLAWARELGHDGSLCHAMDIALMHHSFRRDLPEVLEHAQWLVRFGEDKAYADLAGKGQIFQGWARAVAGDAVGGAPVLAEGLARQRDISTMEDFPMYFSMAAETMALAGRHEEALATLREDEELLRRIGLAAWAPEIKRWKGRLLRVVSPGDHAAAVAAFTEAMEQARAQGALALELRAALDLARIRRDLGADAGDAAGVVEAVLARLGECPDTDEIIEARRTVAALRAGVRAGGPVHSVSD